MAKICQIKTIAANSQNIEKGNIIIMVSTNYNGQRPGVYVDFKGTADIGIVENQRSVMAIALKLDFGASGKIIEVTNSSDIKALFGRSLNDDLYPLLSGGNELFLLKEAFKKAGTVLVYRTTGGERAVAMHGDVMAEAVHVGSRGNALAFQITQSGEFYEVQTYLDGALMHTQTVKTAAELEANSFLEFTCDELQAVPLTSLSGGTDTAEDTATFDKFFQELAKRNYNSLCYCGEDNAIKESHVRFIKSERESEGKFVNLVLSDYKADYEAVISLKNGVILTGGELFPAKYACVYIAAACANALANESLTYAPYIGAADIDEALSNSEITQMLSEGHMVLTKGTQGVIIERDINTLLNYSDTKPAAFAKNRLIRTLDTIAFDIKEMCKSLVIGKLSNNSDGRNIIKSSIVNYLKNKVAQNTIDVIDSATDVIVSEGSAKDEINIELSVVPIDATERIYISLYVA